MHMGNDSLKKQLETFRDGFLARLPPGDRAMVLSAADELRARAEERKSPRVGDIAPAFALPDEHGRIVHLAERLANGPVVLLFVRGGWCPFCTLTLRAYQAVLPEIHAAGADLLAISPQPAGSCSAMAERDLLAFSTLSDQGMSVARRYGLDYEMAPFLRALYTRLGHDLPRIYQTGTWVVPFSASFIIGQDGRVVRAHIDTAPHHRLEPADALKTLRTLRDSSPLEAEPVMAEPGPAIAETA